MTTIFSLYQQTTNRLSAAGIEDAATEATIILRHILRCRRADIFLNGAKAADHDAVIAVQGIVERRLGREPLTYIIGEQDFFGRAFWVTPAVLIPRQETELLIEKAASFLRSKTLERRQGRVLDLGTGSGIIAITLALEHPASHLIAVDRSLDALTIAKRNAVRHAVVDRIGWINANWGTALADGTKFDLVAANPPYVAARDRPKLQPELAAEPAMALFGGEDGLDEVVKIIRDTPRLLRPGGALLMEIGYDQEPIVISAAHNTGEFDSIMVHHDYAGHPRLLEARKN